MKRDGICCGGNWIIDHVKTISVWPQQDALANILAEETGTGGSAYNVLIDLARFEMPIPLMGVGLVGDDDDGQQVIDDCKRHGIDTRFLKRVPDAPTAYTDVMTVQGTGRRTFFHHRGANALLAPGDFPAGEIDCRVFQLGYLLLLDALDAEDPDYGTAAARVLARFRERGVLTSIDVVSEDSDRFPRIVTPALRHADFCIINEFEATRTTGIEIRRGGELDESAIRGAAEALLGAGVGRWVVIHAPELSVGLSRSGECCRQPSHLLAPEEIAGTVGAGDAFLAGMLAGIHEDWSLRRALKFATTAAATCLRHPTTTGGVGTAAEIESLGAVWPWRD